MRPPLLTPDLAITFADYFKLNAETEDVLAYFGYSFASADLALPRSDAPLPWAADLASRLSGSLPYVSLTSETARREVLIAPIVLDVARHLHVRLRIEYPIRVSHQLQCTLDYYLQSRQQLLIIEAKNADLQRGFTQLAAELIALSQWSDVAADTLYGVVSIGNVWQFGQLERARQHITQDLNLYRVPADLEELLRALVAILGPPAQQ